MRPSTPYIGVEHRREKRESRTTDVNDKNVYSSILHRMYHVCTKQTYVIKGSILKYFQPAEK